jgi:hypothetical protein
MDEVDEPLEVEAALLVTATEVGGADLEDEVAALAVVVGEPALARVVQGVHELDPLVERPDGRPGQRAEAHRRDVDDRVRSEGVPPPPGGTQDLGARQPRLVAGVGVARWRHGGEGALLDDGVALVVLDVVVGAEALVVVLELGRTVDPGALVPAERPLLVVARDDVLTQFRPDRLEQVAPVPDDREVAQEGMFALDQVIGRDPAESE